MRSSRWVRTALVAVGLAGLLAVPAAAELFFQGQIWGEEFEDGPGELRQQFDLFQIIAEDRFAAYREVVVLFQLELGNVPAIANASARVRLKVFKANGSKIRLPMMRVDLEDNVAELERVVSLELEPGDVIRWRIRFVGMPGLPQDAACQIIVGVANKPL